MPYKILMKEPVWKHLGEGVDIHTYGHTQRISHKDFFYGIGPFGSQCLKRIIKIESIGGRSLDVKFSEKVRVNFINTMVNSNVSGVSIFWREEAPL
jgi:hypothetical protein